MARSIEEITAALPAERQARIEARYRELKDEVESLQTLRQVAGKAQAEIAAALNIKQPSVSRIERQADMYLSTLRNYVEAMGGELELVVRLPSRPPVRLQKLGDVTPSPARAGAARRKPSDTTKRRSA